MLTELCTKKATATDATESTVQRYSITEQMTQWASSFSESKTYSTTVQYDSERIALMNQLF